MKDWLHVERMAIYVIEYLVDVFILVWSDWDSRKQISKFIWFIAWRICVWMKTFGFSIKMEHILSTILPLLFNVFSINFILVFYGGYIRSVNDIFQGAYNVIGDRFSSNFAFRNYIVVFYIDKYNILASLNLVLIGDDNLSSL